MDVSCERGTPVSYPGYDFTTARNPTLRYRGTSLIRTPPSVGPYSRTMPRALWKSKVVLVGLCRFVRLKAGQGWTWSRLYGLFKISLCTGVPRS